MKKRLFFFILLLALAVPSAMAQAPTTQGTEFWVSFMRNGYRNGVADHLFLIASAKNGCQVTVSNPNTNYTNTFSVPNQGVYTLGIPDLQGYNEQRSGKANKGLLVTSTDTISLYIGNEAQNSYDASNVLPVQALGCDYLVQSFKSIDESTLHYSDNRASFLVIATQDDTEVEIHPSCMTEDNNSSTYLVHLDAGECYHVLNKYAGSYSNSDGDFSGTRVTSHGNKPIAVFNGNCITTVSEENANPGFDHVFEQAMPVNDWGSHFVVTATAVPLGQTIQQDWVKITALNDNTEVYRDGALLCRLEAGESYPYKMNDLCDYLESQTTNPIAVFLYNHSHCDGNDYGDPSMVWISPIEQTVEEVTFSTFAATNGLQHFVNIVCYSEYVSGMTLDHNDISSYFQEVDGEHGLSYARIDGLEQGAHTLRCPGGFIAHVYGNGVKESYAYTVGSSAKDLTAQLFINDAPAEEFAGECQDEEVRFRVETNYEIHHVEWDFGDNLGATGVEATHAYNSAGRFEVKSVIFRDLNTGVQPFDTLSVIIPVFPSVYGYVNLVSCDDFPGVFYDTLQSFHGCDSIVITTITPGGVNMAEPIVATACEEYVFRDSVFTSSGYHEYLVEKEVGCDSLYTFDLTIVNLPEHPEKDSASCKTCWWHGIECTETRDYTKTFYIGPHHECSYDSILHFTRIPAEDMFDTIVSCDSYYWEEASLNLTQPDDYNTTVTAPDGCETNYHLHLELNHKPPFNEIKGLSNVAVATNFWPGEYNYFVDDTTDLDTQRVEWELSDNENGEWGFRPHGASCTIVTYTKATKELTARASGGDDCEKTVSITINSSGYAVDETETMSLVVYPNPAKEEVIVEGNELTDIILYNLLGQKIKEVNVDGETSVRMEVGDLPKGLYLVNVITRRGNKTQLVSVIK